MRVASPHGRSCTNSACATRSASADVGVGGVGPAEGEVLPDAHREERRVLEGGGDDAAQLGQRQVADVDAVQGDPAAR